jgi:hypothetical protein
MRSVIFLLGAVILPSVKALIAYDCGQKFANFTTFSLIGVEECDIPDPILNSTDVQITIVQANEFTTAHVIYCKVVIKRTVQYCGMHSHTSTVRGGEAIFVKETSRDQCKLMHAYGTAKIATYMFHDLHVNGSVSHTITLAGSVDANGACQSGAYYNDQFGEFYKVLVTGYVTIELQERFEPVDIDKNKIRLHTGTTCVFTDTNCMDSEYGYAFWDSLSLDHCQPHAYTRLYKGSALKITEADGENRPLYVVDSHDISFAFKDQGSVNMCAFRLIRTEHPRLFILTDKEYGNFPSVEDKQINNIDIFAYVNSKFVFTERHIKGQMNRLYRDVLMQQCNLERKILANALNLATVAPDQFAYQLMKGPGYMSLLAGEVVHILKCAAVEVRVRPTLDCYQELPVLYKNKTMYLSPKTHILREYGTKTICDTFIPVMYFLGGRWYKLIPNITSQDAPEILKPSTKQTWKYISPVDLANSGIYTTGDLNQLKTFIMFPNEKTAVLSHLALSYSGKSKPSREFSVTQLFNQEAMHEIAESAWSLMYSKLIAFGSLSAACISLLMIIKLIKFIIDTVIHGYALHSIFGWSFYLLAGVWDSMTHLFLHLARQPREENNATQTTNTPAVVQAQPLKLPVEEFSLPSYTPAITSSSVPTAPYHTISANTSSVNSAPEVSNNFDCVGLHNVYPQINIPEITSLNPNIEPANK